jgi:hypothetical protein
MADLGSGIFYGSTLVSNFSNNTQVNVTLNLEAVAALNAAEGSQWLARQVTTASENRREVEL